MAQIFDPAIFDEAVFEAAAGGAWSSGELDTFWARFMEECGNMAEYLERTDPPRPTFSCTKAQLRGEFTALTAIMPATRATLKAAMTYTPAGYQDLLADHLLTENVSGYAH